MSNIGNIGPLRTSGRRRPLTWHRQPTPLFVLQLHVGDTLGGDVQTTGGGAAASKRIRGGKNQKLYIYSADWAGTPPLHALLEEAVFFFMAREGRSHVCISCCTNIVQCRVWKDDGVEGGALEALTSESGRARTKKTAQGKERRLPFVFRDCERDLSQWGIERRGVQTFPWRFSSPHPDSPSPLPSLPCSDFWQRWSRQSVLSL